MIRGIGALPLVALSVFFFLLAAPATAQDPPQVPAPAPRSPSREAAAQDEEKTEKEEEEAPSTWWLEPNAGYGPFHQAALGFFNSLRLGFTPRSTISLPEGAFEFRATESWAKVISEQDGAYNLDYEILRTQASVSYGLTDTTLADLDFNTASRVHGVLDPLMNGFHNTFGIPLGPRGRLPNNSFRIELTPGEGRPEINLDHDAGRPFTRAVVLTVQQTLTQGDENVPAVAVGLSLRPPLGDFEPLQGGLPVDLSGSLSLSKSWEAFTVYFSGDFSWYGVESYGGTALPTTQWGALGAVEWHLVDRLSLVVQCLVMGSSVDAFGPFSRPSSEVCGGAKWEVARDFRIDLGFLHAVNNPINSPDFGFQLEFTLRW